MHWPLGSLPVSLHTRQFLAIIISNVDESSEPHSLVLKLHTFNSFIHNLSVAFPFGGSPPCLKTFTLITSYLHLLYLFMSTKKFYCSKNNKTSLLDYNGYYHLSLLVIFFRMLSLFALLILSIGKI